MKLLFKSKDGGPESSVTGYWLIENKKWFSICLLRFDGESREAYHSHAFNAVSWVLSGGLREYFLDGRYRYHRPSFKMIKTPRTDFHKVSSIPGRTWALSFRGPWAETWQEYLPKIRDFITLKSGRKIVTA
jgi:hypothetical protein